MTAQKCVVEGCNLEYDVICSFSFYNVNSASENDTTRQEWIEGAMHEESECMWRHVSLQLCGYHFELDSQGLWIDSPMLPELLMRQDKAPAITPSASEKRAAEIIRMEHNYCMLPAKKEEPENISRLNVRQLVDTLGYLSLKNLQRKQLWVVKVETDKAEASITQSEQVITKMQDPKQIIEIIPPASTIETLPNEQNEGEEILDDTTISDNFIYEIAEEQEITMDEVKEIPTTPSQHKDWVVNIIPDESKPKYAYIKHCNTGKKKRHFTADMNEITLHGDFENYFILPDVDPSVGVEITTTYEPENYIVDEYQHLVLDERPKKRASTDPAKKKKRKVSMKQQVKQMQIKANVPEDWVKQQVKEIQIKSEDAEDWVIQNDVVYEQDGDEDYEDAKAKARVRRKNKKYLGYDFVT